jgi:CheY-like chemotaxis protein
LILIALTGYGRAEDRAESRKAGFDEHLVKPVHAEQLLRMLRDMRQTDYTVTEGGGRERSVSASIE